MFKPLTVTALLAFTPAALAQSAPERAEAMKEWRTNCSVDDPDLQLIYVSEAVVLGDPTIAKVCIREGLKSESLPVQEAAGRGALALNELIILDLKVPPVIAANDFRAAGIKEVYYETRRRTAYGFVNRYQSALILKVDDFDLTKNNSTWLLAGSPASGQMVGNNMKLSGKVHKHSITIDFVINPDGSVIGSASLSNYPYAFPLSGRLL